MLCRSTSHSNQANGNRRLLPLFKQQYCLDQRVRACVQALAQAHRACDLSSLVVVGVEHARGVMRTLHENDIYNRTGGCIEMYDYCD